MGYYYYDGIIYKAFCRKMPTSLCDEFEGIGKGKKNKKRY